MKVGFQYRNIGVDWFQASAMTFTIPARVTSGPGSSGDGIATMLLGLPDSGSAQVATPAENFFNYAGGFVEDDWRVNEHLF